MSRISPEQAIAPRWVVYRLLGERDELLYVGMSGNLQSRLQQHSKQDYWRLVRSVETEDLPDREAAVMREGNLIYELDPPLNKAGRRTLEGEVLAACAQGQVVSCPDCTAMGLIDFRGQLVDAQVVFKTGEAYGNAQWFHRCPTRRSSAA
jgi:hypothetical protein